MSSMFTLDADIHSAMAGLASRRTDVIEGSEGSPASPGVAGITTGRRRHVIRQRLVRHARITSRMTVCTRTCHDYGMGIRCDQRHPCPSGTVANAACFRRRNMQCRLARSCRTVMTAHTGLACQLGRCMRKTGRQPSCRAVA